MRQKTPAATRRTNALLITGALLLLAAMAIVWLPFILRVPDWSEGAKRIASVENWYPSATHPFYHWLSESELLFIERSQTGGSLKKLHVPTGNVTDLGVLPDGFPPGQWQEMRVSPDGRYLLWMRDPFVAHGADRDWAAVFPLTNVHADTPVMTWKKGTKGVADGKAFWFPDSRRWCYGVPPEGISVLERDSPGRETWRAGPSPGVGRLLGVGDDGAFIGQRARSAPTPRRPRHALTEIVRLTGGESSDSPLACEVLSVLPRHEAVSRETIVALSPNGKEVLGRDLYVFLPWDLRLAKWLWRLQNRLPNTLPGGRIEDRLWVCNIRAGTKRVVTRMPEGFGDPFAASLQWTPDGNAVSFACGGSLYVHPLRP